MMVLEQELSAQADRCRLSPDAADLRAVLARLLLKTGRAAEALQSAEIALALEPGNAEAYGVQAEATAILQAMDPALAALELALVLRPDDPQPALELGHSYVELGRPIDAERAFKRALAIVPQSAAAHAGLGALYLAAGIDDGAEHHSRQALLLKPADAVASQTLAAVLEARGALAEALAVLDEAYSRESLFFERAAKARMTVLVLATQSSGNVPYRNLMPPRLYSRLVWYMEHARLGQVDPAAYDLVFNVIGDPDLAEPSAASVDNFLQTCAKPVLNWPSAVARTRRDRLPDLLTGLAGVVAPPAIRVRSDNGAALAAAAARAGLSAPLLVRPTGSHGGQGLVRVDTLDGLRALGDAFAGAETHLTQFQPYQSEDGLYRKGRVIFVDRRPYPYHWAVADHWLVHYDTAGMDGAIQRQAEERRFLEDPALVTGAGAWKAIQAVGERLDLDYAGLDFGLLPDGRVLVFEANATMLVHPETEDGELAYKNAAVARIVEAFQAMLQQRLAGAAGA